MRASPLLSYHAGLSSVLYGILKRRIANLNSRSCDE